MTSDGPTDNRPFVGVTILGTNHRFLLDTGASISIVGSKGTQFLSSLGLILDRNYVLTLKTADNTSHLVSGVFYVPIEFRGDVKIIPLYSVPTVPTFAILGVNFFKIFDITLYFSNSEWSCSSIMDESHIPNVRNGIIGRHQLSEKQRAVLDDVIQNFRCLASGGLGCTSLLEHVILTGDALPIKQRAYPVSPAIQERMGIQLKRMLDAGVIEKSFSPWSSPVVLVKKRDGGDRLCVDSRKLNSVTQRDSYPLPRVSEILDRLGKSNYLSKIDLKDAFWQIPLSEESKPKTAFSVPGNGLFQFTRLPFGLHNAAQCLQRLMNTVFGSTDYKVFVYLDDLIIATETFEEHVATLNFVLERMEYANLSINIEKSEFCCSSLAYLGYVVDGSGLHTDPGKVDAILNFPLPSTYTDLKRFIGLASWYRRFVRDFATIAAPLHDLTRGGAKNRKIVWNSVAENSFIKLKDALVAGPVLVLPDFSKKFYIHCDASNYGLGAVICQGEKENPIAFTSRKFRGPEVRYSTPEKECLAVFFAIHQFRPYIEGYHFTIVTDCSALIQLFKQENPPGRLARWIMYLSQYSFDIVHRKGVSNVVPDTLSRTVDHLNLISIDPIGSDEWYIRMLAKVALSPDSFKDWKIKDEKLYYKQSQMGTRNSSVNTDDPSHWLLVVPESHFANCLKRVPRPIHCGSYGRQKDKKTSIRTIFLAGCR